MDVLLKSPKTSVWMLLSGDWGLRELVKMLNLAEMSSGLALRI